MLNELLSTVDARSGDKIARVLIEHFGSVNGVLSADPINLIDIKGVTPKHVDVIKACRRTMSAALYEDVKDKPLASSRDAVERFLKMELGPIKVEQVIAIFVDGGSRVIGYEVMSTGTVNQAVVYPRVIFEKAMNRNAAAIILAHNHPGGSLYASDADWALTERLLSAGKLLDIALLDHVIITESRCVSMRDQARWPS